MDNNTTKQKKPLNKTFNKARKNKVKCNLSMVDCPIYIVREFTSDVKSRYGNIYWVKLMDLMRKSEAYDMFTMLGLVPKLDPQPAQEQQDEDNNNDKGVMTMTGMKKE